MAEGMDNVHFPLTRENLEMLLGFRVAQFDMYIPVFTHKSAMKFTQGQSYERYEFMGDAVINFVVAKLLFDMYPAEDEGFLTKVRTKLVSGKCLAELSYKLGLQRFIIMSERSLKSGFHTNPRILEDVFESLVGCIYLDLGMVAAKTFLLGVYDRFVSIKDMLRDTNYKDGLMRFAQARALALPEYLVSATSADASRAFTVVVRLGTLSGKGIGSSKKNAEQEAACHLLGLLGCLTPTGDVLDVTCSQLTHPPPPPSLPGLPAPPAALCAGAPQRGGGRWRGRGGGQGASSSGWCLEEDSPRCCDGSPGCSTQVLARGGIGGGERGGWEARGGADEGPDNGGWERK